MSQALDYLRGLDHVELDELVHRIRPVEWEPGEQEAVEALLDAVDPDAPIEVLPPVRRAA